MEIVRQPFLKVHKSLQDVNKRFTILRLCLHVCFFAFFIFTFSFTFFNIRYFSIFFSKFKDILRLNLVKRFLLR